MNLLGGLKGWSKRGRLKLRFVDVRELCALGQ